MYFLFPRIWFDGVLQCKRFSWRKIWARSDPLRPARYHAHCPTNRVRESFISMTYAKITLCTFTSLTLFVFQQYIVQGDTHLFVFSFFYERFIWILCCRDVLPQGLPDEYAFVTTFKFRKTSRKEDWYLWQVYDKYGIPQVCINESIINT